MAGQESSRVNPRYKTRYRVTNWPDYECGLRSRGNVTIWLSDEAIAAWNPPKGGRPGGQQRYSDLAILTGLTLRTVFHLPLRQAEGFVGSLLRLMALELTAPDHTTLSRRSRDLSVPTPTRVHDGPIHLIVDSTGLKVFGAGQWCARKHRALRERRTWRKLHVGVDAEGYVVAAELTESTEDDAVTLPRLLEQIDAPIQRFTGDGSYDTRHVYDLVGGVGTDEVALVIPPHRRAVPTPEASGTWCQRNTALERIAEVGRQEWIRASGYRQQARVENLFGRYKRVLGDGLRARDPDAQNREAMIGCHVLNRMLELGRPESYRVLP